MTRLSSTVSRPKSIATVVVVFSCTALESSTRPARTVMAASVSSGSISEMAPTKVVLPTPKPPAMTNLTAVTWRDLGALEGTDSLDHSGEGGELDLDWIGGVNPDLVGIEQVAGQNVDDDQGEMQVGGEL